ncbi:unnamed protein product [Lymnaea stagnalis]|uniref:Uncharacterized protein n=1 Tax=Lymnaea stagnalis TaxID=6523 RepID=A0AAV2H4N8_LYMST
MKPKSWLTLTLCLTILATVLQIAGVVTPLWIWLKTSDYRVGVGLFYRIGCEDGNGGNCSTASFPKNLPFGYDSASTYNKTEWEAIVWLETISACIAVLLSVMMIVYYIGFGVWKKMSNLNLTMVITAFCVWSPLLAGHIVYFVFYGRVITRSPDINSESFPWSPLICFLALFLFLAVTWLVHFKCRNRNFIEHAIPTSADSKMVLNPSTKNQLMKRYFTPTPYREDRRQALHASAYTDQSYLLGSGSSRGTAEYAGVNNGGLRAIEYSSNQRVEGVKADVDYSFSPVIETAGLSAGITSGETIVRNGQVQGHLQGEIDYGYTQNNYGTQIVERTFVTRRTGDAYVDQIEAPPRPPQVDVNEYNRRQEEQHRQWEILQAQAAERRIMQERQGGIIRNEVTDSRNDGFSDIDLDDARTVYYTGKERARREGVVDSGLTRKNTTYTTVVQANESQRDYEKRFGQQQGVVSREIRTEVLAAPSRGQEQIVREVTLLESGGRGPAGGQYRITADRTITEGVNDAGITLVHTRNPTAGKVVMAPGHLSGDRFKYNGTYIYRPYSEDIY